MIETRQNSYLVRYAVKLLIFTEIFMFMTIIILYGTLGKIIPTFTMLFLAPLLGGILSGKNVNKNGKILFEEDFYRKFYITNFGMFVAIYLINFRYNLVMFFIYGVGAIIGCLLAKRKIVKFRKNEKEDDNINEIKIKEYKMKKFNTDSIKEYLRLNNFEEEDYIFIQILPTFLEKILYGYMSITGYLQYIIHFKNAKIYFFELSAINNKKIKNAFCIELNENNIKKFKKGLINYKFTYTFDDGLKTIIQIPKKVNKLYLQSQYAEKFFNEYIEG